MTSKRVAVVGGGITGLTAALVLTELARQKRLPLELDLFEAGQRLGGKIRTQREGELVMELGPDSFLRRKPWALELSHHLGLGSEVVTDNPAARKLYVAFRRRLHPLPDGMTLGIPLRPAALFSSGLLTFPGKVRAALEPFVPPRRDAGDETIAAFARRRLGREAAERMLEPFLKAPYAGRAGDLSLLATFPQLRELERRYGSLTRGLAERRRQRGGAGDEPMDEAVFATLRGGLERLVRGITARLATARGAVRIRVGVAVQRLEPLSGGRYRLWTADGGSETFDGVILTTPAHASARLLAPVAPDASAALGAIPYASVGVAVFAFPRAAISHPLDGSGILVPEGEDLTVTGCAWLSSKWPHTCPPDWALIRCFFACDPRAEGSGNQADEDVTRRIRRELAELIGVQAEPALTRVTRWYQAIPQYTLGHLDRLRVIDQALAAHPRLLVAGASLRGVGIPDCIRQAREAAERLLAELTRSAT